MKHRLTHKSISLKNIKNAIIRFFVFSGVRFCLKSSNLKWLALLIGKSAQRIYPREKSNLPRIWLLGKDGFDEDFNASLGFEPWCQSFNLSRGIPKILAASKLPYWIDDNNYASAPSEFLANKQEYRGIWEEVFAQMPAKLKPKAILTGNFGYYAERELANAASQMQIPFIAIHKECLKSPGRVNFFRSIYERRGKFTGRKLLVYNNIERNLQISSGVVQPNDVSVCGMPRLDRLHRIRRELGVNFDSTPTLLVMGFTPNTGLPRIPRKTVDGSPATFEYLCPSHRELNWNKFFEGYLLTVVKLAHDHPQWRVILKLKAKFGDANPSIEFLRGLRKPDNLVLVVGGDPIELIKSAHVICGFNTTTILEGIAAGIPAVTPLFGEALELTTREYAVNFGKGVFTPTDENLTYKIISELMNAKTKKRTDLTFEQKETLDKWAGNSDGFSGDRLRNFIINEIK